MKDNPNSSTHTLNERGASEFSLTCPTKKEVRAFNDAREEEERWQGDYRKFWAPCNYGETQEDTEKLTSGRSIDTIVESWMSKYQVEVKLITDMWCGLYVDIQGTKIYTEGDTPLLCFAMADKILSENIPREDWQNVFKKSS